MAFRGGRFHDIKELLVKIGLAVTDVDRRKFGPLELDRINLGQVAELAPKNLEQVLDKSMIDWRTKFEVPVVTASARLVS